MSTHDVEKDFIMMVGFNYVNAGRLSLYLSTSSKNPASFETSEDAYNAKMASDNEDIKQYARIYSREVTTRLERV